MAFQNVPVFPQKPQHFEAAFVNADGTTLKTLYTGAANGTIIRALTATSNDVAGRNVQFGITLVSTFYPIGTVSVPAASGTDGSTAAVDLMNSTLNPGLPVDEFGMHYLILLSGEILQAKMLVAVTAADQVTINGFGQDY
jgi:hypothetical protein